MSESQTPSPGRRLNTPRAAAVAGILFAILYGTSQVLIRLVVPSEIAAGQGVFLAPPRYLLLALNLMPFAGIAFLWFMGVVRDHIGQHEDRFFATVLLGSGLLYLGMNFIAAALAGGLISSLAIDPQSTLNSPLYNFGRLVIYEITNTYGIRMAGVFMISSATIWVRTRVMPRWLAFITYGLALIMLVSTSVNGWFTLLFPGWVFVISALILIRNLGGRERAPETPQAA